MFLKNGVVVPGFNMDSDNPLISVVIPTRNRSLLLKRAIESVLSQRYGNMELIIVDDASEDTTLDVVKSYQKSFRKFKYIHNNRQCGAAGSRNIGIRAASGKCISFLDDDDEWLPEKLGSQKDFLDAHPDIMAVSCWYIEDIYGRKRTKVKKYDRVSFKDMLWENFMGSFSFVMVRREIFDKIGLLDETLTNCQDWDIWLRVSRDYKIGVVNRYLTIYYRHSGKKISTLTTDTISNYFKVCEKYKDFMGGCCKSHHLKRLIILESRLITGVKKRLENFTLLLKRYNISYRDDSVFILYGFMSLLFEAPFFKKLTGMVKRPFHSLTLTEFRRIYEYIHRER